MSVDICVVGHVTRDVIGIGDKLYTRPGGVAYYGSLAAAALSARVCAITRLAQEDVGELLADLRQEGIQVVVVPCTLTTTFENVYDAPNSLRTQTLRTSAEPLTASHMPDLDASVWLFGPLMPNDIEPDCLEAAASTGAMVALDLQGLVRAEYDGVVRNERSPDLSSFLRHTRILKVSASEVKTATGLENEIEAVTALSAQGPSEVVVTRGSEGSCVYVAGQRVEIPAYPAVETVDTTGCGDTYFSSYLWARVGGSSPYVAGNLASAASAFKAARVGYLHEDQEQVLSFVRNVQLRRSSAG